MAAYVDNLRDYGWRLRGHAQLSCHLMADTEEELHAMAQAVGMRLSWFQLSRRGVPHYDLTAKRRAAALAAGALEASRDDLRRLTGRKT